MLGFGVVFTGYSWTPGWQKVFFFERIWGVRSTFRGCFLRSDAFCGVFRISCQMPVVSKTSGSKGGGPCYRWRDADLRVSVGVWPPSFPPHLTLITPRITCVIKKSAVLSKWQRDKITNLRPAGRPHLIQDTGPRFCHVFFGAKKGLISGINYL